MIQRRTFQPGRNNMCIYDVSGPKCRTGQVLQIAGDVYDACRAGFRQIASRELQLTISGRAQLPNRIDSAPNPECRRRGRDRYVRSSRDADFPLLIVHSTPSRLTNHTREWGEIERL